MLTVAIGLVVSAPVTLLAGYGDQLVSRDIWPYAVAGLLAPGAAQLLFVYAVGAVGAARSATLISAAPLLAAVPALVVLDEPLRPALLVGAVLIVAGAVTLSGEGLAATEFRRIGILYALGSAALIATRDNFVRWFARDDDVPGLAAGTASLVAAAVFLLVYLVASRGRGTGAALRLGLVPFLPAGALLGLAYLANLEALDRGRVTVVSPFYGTEALWAVLLAYLFLGRSERIGPRVVAAAALMVVGTTLIGAFG